MESQPQSQNRVDVGKWNTIMERNHGGRRHQGDQQDTVWKTKEETPVSQFIRSGQMSTTNATPFEKDVRSLDDEQVYDSNGFIKNFVALIDKINKLSVPIQYEKSDQKKWHQEVRKEIRPKPQSILFGEMGNGKSTTGNALAKLICTYENRKFWKNTAFVASKCVKSVTKDLTVKHFSCMNIMDTPGFNDPGEGQTLKDSSIYQQITRMIQNNYDFKFHGVATLINCVLIPESGRIPKSAIVVMSKILQIFTLSYPDSDQQGPKPFVLFNNFSRFEDPKQEEGYNSYDDEDDVDKENENDRTRSSSICKNDQIRSNIDTSQLKTHDQYPTLQNLMKGYKEDLVSQLMEDQSIFNRNTVIDIVDRLLPEKNFFTYKQDTKYKKEQKQMETTEIDRIVIQTMEEGSYQIKNPSKCYLQPIMIDNECRDQIIKQLEGMLQFCRESFDRGLANFLIHSKGHVSEEVQRIEAEIQKITKSFNETLKKKPYSIQKASAESLHQVQSMMKKFQAACSFTFQNEMAKFNVEEAKKMNDELKRIQEEQRIEQQRLISKLSDQLSEMKRQEEERRERRKRNVYNPRFANKSCWNCGIHGHLIYWCPGLD